MNGRYLGEFDKKGSKPKNPKVRPAKKLCQPLVTQQDYQRTQKLALRTPGMAHDKPVGKFLW